MTRQQLRDARVLMNLLAQEAEAHGFTWHLRGRFADINQFITLLEEEHTA